MPRYGQWVMLDGQVGIYAGAYEVHLVHPKTGETTKEIKNVRPDRISILTDVKKLPEARRRHLPAGYQLRP